MHFVNPSEVGPTSWQSPVFNFGYSPTPAFSPPTPFTSSPFASPFPMGHFQPPPQFQMQEPMRHHVSFQDAPPTAFPFLDQPSQGFFAESPAFAFTDAHHQRDANKWDTDQVHQQLQMLHVSPDFVAPSSSRPPPPIQTESSANPPDTPTYRKSPATPAAAPTAPPVTPAAPGVPEGQLQARQQQAAQQLLAAAAHVPQSHVSVRAGTELDNGQGTKYLVIQELGSGHFGSVFKVQRVYDGKVMAIKVQMQMDQRQAGEVRKEVNLLKSLRHPNIVSFTEDFKFSKYICIVMEFCGGGTLQKHIESRKRIGFSEFRLLGYIRQLTDGLLFIHGQNVTHRDLKSENIMMTTDLDIKISDFGTGKALPEGVDAAMTMTGGDVMVIPPEFAHRAQGVPRMGLVGPKYDMWGLGCIISELVTLKLLRRDRCRHQPLALNSRAFKELMSEAKQVYSGKFFPLIQGLLQKDPNVRLSSLEVSRALANYVNEAASSPNARAGAMDADQLEAWRMFQQADTNGDGVVDVRELRALLAVLQIHASASALVQQFDTTGVGGLDFTQFARWWAGRNTTWLPAQAPDQPNPDGNVFAIYDITPEAYRQLQTQFLANDRDHTGTITPLVLYYILTQFMGLAVDWDAFQQSVGNDWADQAMTFDEVLYWWKGHVDWAAKCLRTQAPAKPAYYKGQAVLLLRSSGAWEAAVVQEAKEASYVVAFHGNTKEIPFRLTERFLRPY